MPGRGAPKRRLILEAARELFLRHGFAETSTDAIALRAGVSKETLYRHYPSKEVLLVAVMEELTVDRLALLAGRSLPPRATREDLEAVLDEILRDALQRLMDRDYLELARLAIGESGRRPRLGELYRKAVPEAGARALTTLLVDARDQGLLRPDLDLEVTAFALVGPSIIWMITRGVLAGDDPSGPPPKEWTDAVVRLVLEGAAVPREPGSIGASR